MVTSIEFKQGKTPLFVKAYKKRKGTIDLIIGLVLLFLLCINLLSILVYYKEPQMSPYSDAWNGTSSVREDMEFFDMNVSVVYSTLDVLESVEKPEGSVLMIMGVEKEVSNSEIIAIQGFVENGGTLILADDSGRFSNKIFETMFDRKSFLETLDFYDFFDFTYRFDGDLVRDIEYDQSPDFITETAQRNGREYQLTFNAPSSIQILDRNSLEPVDYGPKTKSEEFEVICGTTDFAWKDGDANYRRDPHEMTGYLPLIVSTTYYAGNVHLIGDPGVFVNEMWNKTDNREFVLDLVNSSLNKQTGFVFMDNSKHFQDSLVKNSGQTLLSWSIFASSGRLTYIFWIILIVALIYVLVKVTNLKRYRHITLVNYPWLGRFRSPFVNYSDYMWMRSIFLEKVRILSGIEKDGFYTMSREELEGLIYDPVLIHYLFDSATPPPDFRGKKKKKNYYEEVASRMGRWRPRRGA